MNSQTLPNWIMAICAVISVYLTWSSYKAEPHSLPTTTSQISPTPEHQENKTTKNSSPQQETSDKPVYFKEIIDILLHTASTSKAIIAGIFAGIVVGAVIWGIKGGFLVSFLGGLIGFLVETHGAPISDQVITTAALWAILMTLVNSIVWSSAQGNGDFTFGDFIWLIIGTITWAFIGFIKEPNLETLLLISAVWAIGCTIGFTIASIGNEGMNTLRCATRGPIVGAIMGAIVWAMMWIFEGTLVWIFGEGTAASLGRALGGALSGALGSIFFLALGHVPAQD